MADLVNEREEEERFLKHADTDVSTGESSSVNPTRNVYEDRCEGRVVLYSLVAIVEILGLVCIVLACVWTSKYLGGFAWDGSGKMFNWHPVFMTVGLVVCYGNAAIVYRVLRNTEKYTVKLIHGALNASAFIFAVLGLYSVFTFHNHFHIPNMYSIHSWVGLTAVVLYACQLLFGFLGFLYPKFSDDIRKLYLDIHVYFGGIILAFVVVACVSGITEKMLFGFMKVYSKFPPIGIVANAYGMCIILFAMLVGYILHNRKWKRVEEA